MLRRNVADQPVLVGPLLTTDGTAQTSGAAVTVRAGGVTAAGAGTLTHVTDGVWEYTPTAAETDYDTVGLILTKAGAVAVPVTVVTTQFPTQQALTFASDEVLTTGTTAVTVADPSAAVVDTADNPLSAVTVVQALAALLAAAAGGRTGVGTSEIVAALGDAAVTATRISRSVIDNVVVVPPAP